MNIYSNKILRRYISHIIRLVRYVSIILAVLMWSIIVSDSVHTFSGNVLSIMFFIPLMITLVLYIFIDSNTYLSEVGLIVRRTLIFSLIFMGVYVFLWADKIIRDSNKTLFSISYDWKEQFIVDFREDGSFKAINMGMLGDNWKYGKYRMLVNEDILLLNPIPIGSGEISDTLKIKGGYVYFTIKYEKPKEMLLDSTKVNENYSEINKYYERR